MNNNYSIFFLQEHNYFLSKFKKKKIRYLKSLFE